MGLVKAIVRIVVGAIFGLLSSLALIPAMAAFSDGSGNTAWLTLVVVGIGALLSLFAPTIRRAFGRGFLLTGISVFALPLSTLLLSGRVAADMMATTDNQAAAAIGSGLAGTMLTGMSAMIGFFLGTIFLIAGLVLVLGGRREVVVVEQRAIMPVKRAEPSL